MRGRRVHEFGRAWQSDFAALILSDNVFVPVGQKVSDSGEENRPSGSEIILSSGCRRNFNDSLPIWVLQAAICLAVAAVQGPVGDAEQLGSLFHFQFF